MSRRQTAGNLALGGYEDVFKSSVTPMRGEQVIELLLSELYPPEFHPFQVNDDAAMNCFVGMGETCL